jgi:hypothetical protein
MLPDVADVAFGNEPPLAVGNERLSYSLGNF